MEEAEKETPAVDSSRMEAEPELESDDEPSSAIFVNLGRLASHVAPFVGLIVLGTVFSAIDAIATAQQSNLVGAIVDTFGGTVTNGAYDKFFGLLVQLSSVYVIEAVFAFLVAYCFKTAGYKISSLLASLLPELFVAVGMSIFNVMFLLMISWKLFLALLFTLPFIGLAMYGQGRVEKNDLKLSSNLADRSNQKSLESISHIRTIRLFGQEKAEAAKYGKIVHGLDDVSRRVTLVQSLASTWVIFAFNICIVVVFWVGGRSVFEGEITGGQIISFSLFALSLTEQVGSAPQLLSSINKLFVSIEKISSILDQQEAAPSETLGTQTLPLKIRGDIRFENVTFAYPSRQNQPALKNFNLHVAAGSRVALVGKTGSGKSTVTAVLARLYELSPDGGRILVDGVDTREIDPDALRRQIAVVPQEAAIFSGTIRDNILFGSDQLLMEPDAVIQKRVESAAKAANAHEFIVQRGGYDVVIGERGANLSGGERQRIAIARALLRDPAVLTADEATSALDTATERQVQDALDHVMRDRTSIVIAHRLSTIKAADLIAVVDDGSVVESGTHDALLQRRGFYWELYTKSGSHVVDSSS